MRSPVHPRPGQCRFCGCTYTRPCVSGCAWWDGAQTVCTRCVERVVDLAALVIWAQAHPEQPAAIARTLRDIQE